MKLIWEKSISLLLVCTMLFTFTIPVYADNNGGVSYEEYTQTTNPSVIDGEEVIRTFTVPIVTPCSSKIMPQYLVFNMTRYTIYWNLVGFPVLGNWHFSRDMRVTNATSGLVDSWEVPMSGTFGSIPYSGYLGNTYFAQVDGILYFVANGTFDEIERPYFGFSWVVK